MIFSEDFFSCNENKETGLSVLGSSFCVVICVFISCCVKLVTFPTHFCVVLPLAPSFFKKKTNLLQYSLLLC